VLLPAPTDVGETNSLKIDYGTFPLIDATLNGITAVLLAVGHEFIKRGQVGRHRATMITAFLTSCVFLCCYLYYHAHVGSVRFRGQGWSRPVYFSILISHTILAAVIVPLILITLTLALRNRFDRHRSIARWTYPIWMYVSVTGVIVYLMLYKLFI
jgi:putative membrane protein